VLSTFWAMTAFAEAKVEAGQTSPVRSPVLAGEVVTTYHIVTTLF
jgi:hypothetical protein